MHSLLIIIGSYGLAYCMYPASCTTGRAKVVLNKWEPHDSTFELNDRPLRSTRPGFDRGAGCTAVCNPTSATYRLAPIWKCSDTLENAGLLLDNESIELPEVSQVPDFGICEYSSGQKSVSTRYYLATPLINPRPEDPVDTCNRSQLECSVSVG